MAFVACSLPMVERDRRLLPYSETGLSVPGEVERGVLSDQHTRENAVDIPGERRIL